MGFFPSLYLVTKNLMVVDQTIRGDRRSRGNIFRWKKIILNLPGTNSHDSSMPWVYKVGWDSEIAGDLYGNVYNERPTASFAIDNWRATQRVF